MPLDGILIGTAAMATKEATTNPDVKKMLVETAGIDEWIGAGHATAGMASGRSQLGADIHEVDNAASRCGRLLDEVAGDAEAVAARRDEIIAAMAVTAKPYFGDVDTMTYRQWLERYATLAVGDAHGDHLPWADITWQQRFVEMLQRTEARMHPQDSGPIPTMFADISTTDDPHAAIDALGSVYPEIDTDILHPADVAFFFELCRTPGKPVNFVPVIDKDVRRWWRSDSLWQAHDPRYSADEVCIIPGPVAVAGITRVDEPVGELLDRFEARVVTDLKTAGERPVPVASRHRAGRVDEVGALTAVIESADVSWAGRIVPNPIALLGDVDRWTAVAPERAEHAPTGAVLEQTASEGDSVRFDLVVPISGASVRIPIVAGAGVRDGGAPIVGLDDASAAMREILTVAAGGSLAEVTDGVATTTITWQPDTVADHASVTGFSLPAHLRPTTPTEPFGFAVPDTLVGACWPSVFSVIGAARTDAGTPVVEGLLDLVHLDHAIHVTGEIPTEATDLTVTARTGAVHDSEVGRVIEVSVEIVGEAGPVATLEERFAIRGRLGDAELTAPLRAGGALDDERSATRKLLRTATITAPSRMNGFAVVSGDRNPIHTDASAAKLAGLKNPIVHGMWLSAAAQQVVTATDAKNPIPSPRPLVGWTARYLGMVASATPPPSRRPRRPRQGPRGRRGQRQGRRRPRHERHRPARRAAHRLRVPGPGHPDQGDGARRPLAVQGRARQLGPGRQAHPQGAGLLDPRRRPRQPDQARRQRHHLPAPGRRAVPDAVHPGGHGHPGCRADRRAQGGRRLRRGRDHLRPLGRRVQRTRRVRRVLPLEAVLEVVFQRGEAMHHLVPRDEQGRSNYRMAAIRPSQFGLADAEVTDFVSGLGEQVGEFLEVVNLNLLGSQYAIAGTVRGLKALEAEIDRRRAEFGGKRAFILIPGIDVPFHSTVLRAGVPEFRHKLEDLLPHEIDVDVLVGRYIPNLVPCLFNLGRDFVEEIAALVPSDPLNEVLATGTPGRGPRPAGPRDPDRAAGLAVRQPGALDRDPGPAVQRPGAQRPGRAALRRDRPEGCADAGRPGDQHPQARRLRLGHHGGRQRRTRLGRDPGQGRRTRARRGRDRRPGRGVRPRRRRRSRGPGRPGTRAAHPRAGPVPTTSPSPRRTR